MPSDIVDDVRVVLLNSHRGDWERPNFLTTYQILERLPHVIRDRLIAERTTGGRGSGVHYSAITVVAQAASLIPGVVTEYLDTVGLSAQVSCSTNGFEQS